MLTITYDGNPSDLVELGKAISDQIAPQEKTVTEVDKSESILLRFKVDLTGNEDARMVAIPIKPTSKDYNLIEDFYWIIDWGDGNIERVTVKSVDTFFTQWIL
jgi:hypothetical protein